MTLFIISVATVLVVSAICSLTEAAIYAVRLPYIRHLAESGSLAGKHLVRFKENMEQPISAILILNTVANTAGAAVAGAQARHLLGEGALIWFSAAITMGVLVFSEIMPKILGVVYNRVIARAVALPLWMVITSLFPLIWAIQWASSFLKPAEPLVTAPEEEVQQLAQMSAEEGSILDVEARLVHNVLRLNDITARDIMTPRPVVVKLRAEMSLRDVAAEVTEWTHSRIPIYQRDAPETWVGQVLAKDVLAALANDQFDVTLDALAKPLYFVPEQAPGHVLLSDFLRRRSLLFGVVDEYGNVVGVVTLEDVMESLIGEEIVDEADTAVDLQEVARRRHQKEIGKPPKKEDE